MNKRVKLFLIILLGLCVSLQAVFGQMPERGIVEAKNLRVRSSPDLNGEIVGQLQTGETVIIEDRSAVKAKIGNMEDYWLKITRGSLRGWTFGYYISTDYVFFPDTGISVYSGGNMEDAGESFYDVLSPYGEYTFGTRYSSVAFSKSGRYYFIAEDQTGGIRIFDSYFGDLLAERVYAGSMPNWDGDYLEFETVVEVNPDYGPITDWLFFHDGILQPYEEWENEYYWSDGDEGAIGDKYAALYGEDSWDRWIYYESIVPDEMLYQVRVQVVTSMSGDSIRVIFLGTSTDDYGYFRVRLYEYDDNGLYLIYTNPSPVMERNGSLVFVEQADRYYMQSFIRRQSDNFIINGMELYFYVDYMTELAGRNHFVYQLGSRDRPKPITEKEFVEKRWEVVRIFNRDDTETTLVSTTGQKTAYTGTYDISVAWDFDQVKFNRIVDGAMTGWELGDDEDGFHMSDYMGEEFDDELMLIGSLCWDYSDRNIYFDNSGMDYRCIWEFDTMTLQVRKIVPEHEAVQPFYYEIYGNGYIAYTENNTVMIAERNLYGK